MLFNSYLFIFLFLPTSVLLYYLINNTVGKPAAKTWLLLASLFFYGYWSPKYLLLLGTSILVNYSISLLLSTKNTSQRHKSRQALLILGLTINLGLLGYFKYADFFISTINNLSGSNYNLLHVVLPLGISFFTFQQISYLVDNYRNKIKPASLLDYSLFVSFFPQLIAGPIVHQSEMLPQFSMNKKDSIDPRNIYNGLFLFAIGLAKKGVIADSFALWANYGFSGPGATSFFDAWITSLSYTFQIYFDFSGYMDMALGIALLFNIKLPVNFNAPYQAISIQDFWHRWHITLSRFLGEYLYIPLGGNRKGLLRTCVNIMTVFLLGGLWHGAAWTFVIWGALHGAAMIVHRLWTRIGIKLPVLLSWLVTFAFINFTWVFFRADSLAKAINIAKAMFGFNGIVLHARLQPYFNFLTAYGFEFGFWKVGEYVGTAEFVILTAIFGFGVCLFMRPARLLAEETRPSYTKDAWLAVSFCAGILSLSRITEFIYFQF